MPNKRKEAFRKEVRELRAKGLTMAEISTILSKKHKKPISPQVVSYYSVKTKKQ